MKRNVNTLIKYLFDRSGIRLYLSFLLDDRGSDEYIESDCCWKTHTRKSADHEPSATIF